MAIGDVLPAAGDGFLARDLRSGPFDLALATCRRERPLLGALAGSGALHGLLALVLAGGWTLQTLRPPAPVMAPVTLRAVLQPPAQSEAADAAADPVPESRTIVASRSAARPPAPSPPAAAVSPAAATLATAPVASDPRPNDASPAPPEGGVIIALVHDARELGGGLAERIAERYPSRADRPPRLRGALALPYPTAARQSHTSGRVTAVLDIDEQGKIIGSLLVPSHPAFVPAVDEALRDIRFTPAEIASRRVPYWAVVAFTFTIAAPPGRGR